MAFSKAYVNRDLASEIYPIQCIRVPLRTADNSSGEETCFDLFLYHMETLDPVTPLNLPGHFSVEVAVIGLFSYQTLMTGAV